MGGNARLPLAVSEKEGVLFFAHVRSQVQSPCSRAPCTLLAGEPSRSIQSLPFKVPLRCHLLHEIHLDCSSLACTGFGGAHSLLLFRGLKISTELISLCPRLKRGVLQRGSSRSSKVFGRNQSLDTRTSLFRWIHAASKGLHLLLRWLHPGFVFMAD